MWNDLKSQWFIASIITRLQWGLELSWRSRNLVKFGLTRFILFFFYFPLSRVRCAHVYGSAIESIAYEACVRAYTNSNDNHVVLGTQSHCKSSDTCTVHTHLYTRQSTNPNRRLPGLATCCRSRYVRKIPNRRGVHRRPGTERTGKNRSRDVRAGGSRRGNTIAGRAETITRNIRFVFVRLIITVIRRATPANRMKNKHP